MISNAPICRAGSVAAPYEIGTWEGFRLAAVTYTFDDNVPEQYSIAVPMFHAAGFKMTLFTVINEWFGSSWNWSMAQTAASYGDEIASHTVTHTTLTSISAAQLTNELANSQSTINSYITGQSCVTIAYPNCVVPNESTVAQYYIAGRGCSGSLVPSTPTDFMNISSIVLGSAGPYTTGDSIIGLANGGTNSHSWCVYLIHSIDVSDDYSPLSSAALQASVNYFSTNQGKFWVETFGNVTRYIQERNASSVTETANSGNSITVQVTNNLNNLIYNYPITIRRPLPTNWLWATVAQNGVPVPTQQVVTNNSQLYVMFDMVPNGGDVTIAVTNPPGSLQLVIPGTAAEGDGVLAGQGSITANRAPSSDLVVNLTSSNTNKVTVPSSVVISAGQTNAVFDLSVINDLLLDGNQNVTITAVAPVYGVAQATILVYSTNTATLTVTLPASAVQSAGTLTSAGLVSIGTTVAANIPVYLTSSDPSKLKVPATTTLSNGQSSARFNLTLINNNIIQGPQTVSVTAIVTNWTAGSASMIIVDDRPLPDHFTWSVVSSPQWNGGPIPVTITAQDAAGNTLDYRLGVTLGALSPGANPGTNSILNSPMPNQSENDGPVEYTLGYAFKPNTNLTVTGVRHYFGDKISIWTASGQLIGSASYIADPGTWADTALANPILLAAGNTYRVTVDQTNSTFYWNTALPASFADGMINFSCWDYGDVFPTQTDDAQWYSVDLRYSREVNPVSMAPQVTGNFTNGVWSGTIAVLQAASNVTLQATAGPGSSGSSVSFDVLAQPKLAIAALSNSVVLSWPAAATGFNLEQAGTLGNWSGVPGTPTAISNWCYVTNAIGTTNTYYRLHKP